MTPELIENAFQAKLAQVKTMTAKSSLSEHDKILAILENSNVIWWLAQDLMGEHYINGESFYLGYETSARFSELAKLYPDRIESRQCGKYVARRLIK